MERFQGFKCEHKNLQFKNYSLTIIPQKTNRALRFYKERKKFQLIKVN